MPITRPTMGMVGGAMPITGPTMGMVGATMPITGPITGMVRGTMPITRPLMGMVRGTRDHPKRLRRSPHVLQFAMPPSGGGGCGVKPTGVMHDDRSNRMNSIASSSGLSAAVASHPDGTLVPVE
jgi:hypothetical protein